MICDTTFLIDFVNGDENILKVLDGSKLRTTRINQYEFLVGLIRQKNIDLDKKLTEAEEFFDVFEIFDTDNESIAKAAKICGDLLQKGKEIGDHDCLIAGIALRNGEDTIVTKNASHFSRIPGIKVITY